MPEEQVVENVSTEVPSGAARQKWLAEGTRLEEKATEEKKAEEKTQEPSPAESKATEEKETEEKKPEPRVSRSEKRIIELLGEVKALKAQLATPPAEKRTEEKKEAAEVAEKKPELKDFADVEHYVEALTAFNTKAAIKEYETRRATADAEAAAKKADEEFRTSYNARLAKAKERHEDFEEVAFAPELPVKAGSIVDSWLLDSENGMEMLYHLGKHPEELDRINALKPFAQARELTKLELSLSETKSSVPAIPKKVSEAPPPASRVEGEKTLSTDASRQAVMDGDVRAYIAAENEKDNKRSRR